MEDKITTEGYASYDYEEMQQSVISQAGKKIFRRKDLSPSSVRNKLYHEDGVSTPPEMLISLNQTTFPHVVTSLIR